jgi:hypothetical protein
MKNGISRTCVPDPKVYRSKPTSLRTQLRLIHRSFCHGMNSSAMHIYHHRLDGLHNGPHFAA